MDTFFTFILVSFFVLLALVGFSLLYTVPIYFLWNWLAPVIFALPLITFWQAMGLSFLSGLLFKSSSYKSSSD